MNKRKFKRHNKRLEVKYTDASKSIGRGFVKDLSEQGVFIRCRKPASPGASVDITATLPDGIRSRMRGVVRRSVKGAQSLSNSMDGMGVEMLAYDKVYSHFLHTVVGEFEGPDLSMYESSLGAPIIDKHEAEGREASRPSLVPEQKAPESVVIACANCGTKNRVPKDRFSAMPKCGKCGMFLIA